jgi:hypothetical protein
MLAFPFENKPLVRNIFLILAIALTGHYIAYKIVHLPTQLELVILITVAFFYPVIRKPITGVYLLFILMPFIPFIRRLYYLQHQRPKVDPLIAVGDIIVSLTLIGLFFVFREQHETSRGMKTISRIVAVYFAYCLLRTFVLNILPTTEAVMQFHFYGPAVLFFFIGVLYARDTGILTSIWLITIGIGLLAALYGINQLLFGYSDAEKIWFSSISFTTLFIKGLARPFSFFQSPACFADYMLIAIIGLFVVSGIKKIKWRMAIFALLPLFFYGALITSVRSNWIGIVLAVLLWTFLLQLKGVRNRIMMLAAIFLSFVMFQLLDFSINYDVGINKVFSLLGGGLNQQNLDLLVTERTGAIVNPFEEHSLLSRMTLWKYLLVLSADPIMAFMGRGIGTLNADSLYFSYLAQFGYPGVIFIFGFIIITIVAGFRTIDRATDPVTVSLAKGITLMNIVFAIINITGTHIHSFPGDIYFWFWNGVLIKLACQTGTEHPPVAP